jgi:hypothetical protein
MRWRWLVVVLFVGELFAAEDAGESAYDHTLRFFVTQQQGDGRWCSETTPPSSAAEAVTPPIKGTSAIGCGRDADVATTGLVTQVFLASG